MYVCCVAETRHTYPRLERKPGAIPEWDGKSYILRVPDPAVHSLVPEPYLLRPGLAGPLQGRPTGFWGFVSALIIYLRTFFSPAHYDGSFAVYGTLFFQYWHTGVRTLAQSYDYFIVLLLVWLRFYYLYCLTLDTHLKCHGVVCHSCATMCKPVEWIEENDLNVFLSENITV